MFVSSPTFCGCGDMECSSSDMLVSSSPTRSGVRGYSSELGSFWLSSSGGWNSEDSGLKLAGPRPPHRDLGPPVLTPPVLSSSILDLAQPGSLPTLNLEI